VLRAISDSIPYRAALVFYGAYPITMACVWIVLSIAFARRRERRSSTDANASALPTRRAAVRVRRHPGPQGSEHDRRTLEALLQVDYPSYEVIVVNDGSTDDTAGVVRRYLAHRRRAAPRQDGQRRQGDGAQRRDSALPRGDRGRAGCGHRRDAGRAARARAALRVAACGSRDGNPRVANRGSLLRNLQTLEFASIVSVQRRAQRIWGRVLTVSGAIAAFRKTALVDVGLFSPDMATEDIDMTWKLQRRFWDVRYEASAVVWMEVRQR
jgi:biofilm PGA synthesis N-glycosyltransferase PgaC